LERATTAREAIRIMGSLAEEYGFYSADWDTSKYGPSHAMGEGGEVGFIIMISMRLSLNQNGLGVDGD
jgi:hypothetical protein